MYRRVTYDVDGKGEPIDTATRNYNRKHARGRDG